MTAPGFYLFLWSKLIVFGFHNHESDAILSFPTNIPVPSNTTIPQYAATDPRAWYDSGFNVTEARQIALGGPAPAFTVTSSFSSTTTPAHSATETSSSSTASSNSAQPASRQNDTGAIVGGVVGGILGLLLVAVILVWLLCAQSIRKRFGKNTTQPKGEILGRAFDTPTGAPPLANIVVPIPVRPYPVRNGFDSYMSSTSAGSNAGDYPGSAIGHKEMTGPDGLARSDVGIRERGSSQNHRPLARNNTNSSFAASLIQRVSSSMRWRRRTQTNSMDSIGTGTVMTTTATGMDSDTGHGSRNISRQNTARRNVDPIPFVLPSHPEETAVISISAEGADRTSPYGMSAAEEKRRLNPPAYRGSVPWTNGNSRSQNSEPGASNSLDISSGGATAGSENHHGAFAPSAITLGTAMGRTSLPSNIVLPSAFDLLSQDASSGVLDSSPIHVRPPAADLRFTVTNPSVEM